MQLRGICGTGYIKKTHGTDAWATWPETVHNGARPHGGKSFATFSHSLGVGKMSCRTDFLIEVAAIKEKTRQLLREI